MSSNSDTECDGPIIPKVGGGFAALLDDGNDEQMNTNGKLAPSKNEMKEKTTKGKQSKKSKRKDKDNIDDDDDLEQMLADLESEYATGIKKPVIKTKIEESIPVENSGEITDNKSSEEKEEQLKKNNENKEGKQNKKQEKPVKANVNNKNEAKEKSTVENVTTGTDSKKKKKKTAKEKEEQKKKEEEEAALKKRKPNQKKLDELKALQEKRKEEEEKFEREEDERIILEDERIKQREEERLIEEERKERLKQKQKDRKQRLKDEGKLLTKKQKLDQQRRKALLDSLGLTAQGDTISDTGDKPVRAPIYSRLKKKKPTEASKDNSKEVTPEPVEEEKKVEIAVESDNEDGIADTWDADDSDSDEEISSEITKPTAEGQNSVTGDEGNVSLSAKMKNLKIVEQNDSHLTESEKKKDRALARMKQRKIDNENNKSDKTLRSPVICVLGHVDHGKTKILDKLRRTNVQEGEVGGITQQIGATNVPLESIRTQTRMIKDFDIDSVDIPGLLIIDTPGHESFSNLRSRGSSLCDIAILVVDITQGLEPQTIESITLLKNRKTPFVVALNKVDRVFEWESNPTKDIQDTLKVQSEPTKNDFERRTTEIMQSLNVQGLNVSLFWENPDPRSYVSLIPTSAISGDGMGNLLGLIVNMCQKRLYQRLIYSDELQCTVLEVKTIQGHGTTIDVILINGKLREGDTIVLAGTDGPIVTQIRSLLIPQPMKELRVKGKYDELKEIRAALGVKVAARDLERAIAGLNLQVAYCEEEVEILRDTVDKEFKSAMHSIKVKDKGVYVQASTLGALEALLEFFKGKKVPYAGIRVGPVVKRDVMKAAAMLEHDPMFAVILAFDVKVEKDAQELADKEGIKIFTEETIYHLGDRYIEYLDDYKKKKQEENRHIAVFPTKLKIVPDAIFNKRDPIVLGVTVEAGILRMGTLLCVPSKEFVEIGVVTSLEFDHKSVEIAKKGVTVCMKVEPIPGHSPKLFGRHFDVDDILVSKISRESIDACKQFFRDDLGKNEWKLMAELKRQFGIL